MAQAGTPRPSGGGPLGEEGVAELVAETKRRERQAVWVNARDSKLRELRKRRREQLEGENAARGDRMASTAWSWLTGPAAIGPIPGNIGVLSKYVARDDAGAAAALEELQLAGRPSAPRPPMSILAAGSGRSLSLHLAMMAVAQLVTVGGARMVNAPTRTSLRPEGSGSGGTVAKGGLPITTSARDEADWAKLLGIPAVGKARTVRVHEPLRRLQALGFIKYPAGNPSKFTLLSEDGTGRIWTRPQLDPLDPSFGIPFDFWRNRWYLWLTAAEIATLFTIYHAWAVAPAKVMEEGLGLPESVRRSVYDMSPERYNTVHELIEFGLVAMVSPSLRPRQARGPGTDDQPGLTHHIAPLYGAFSVEAREKILERLNASPLPPRLAVLPAMRATYAAQLRAASPARDSRS